jgi:hypothetical protein
MIGAHLTIGTSDGAGGAVQPTAEAFNLALDGQVPNGLNLYLPLKSPAQMPALGEAIKALKKRRIFPALASLDNVHFARFLPEPDGSALWVITTYDGPLEPYVMDFVGVIGDVFTELLQFIYEAPPLPVHEYPREFVAFVASHDIQQGGNVWSAYPETTVIDIQRQGARG